MFYIFMACIVLAYIVLAHVVMAHLLMPYVVVAHVDMAAYIVHKRQLMRICSGTRSHCTCVWARVLTCL